MGWTNKEVEIVMTRDTGASWDEIAAKIPDKTRRAVQRKYFHITESRPRKKIYFEPLESPVDARIRQDLRFQHAMRTAIKMGLEEAPIGIYVTPEGASFNPRYFPPVACMSGCSSSAALCVEATDGEPVF